jgi:hypothetical protein
MATATRKILNFCEKQVNIAPLIFFRIVFGALMFISILRFILKGWVHTMYIQPKMHFPYYGFEWVQALPPLGMYVTFGILLLTSLCIMCGFLYRFSAVVFFIFFSYIELIDKTNYLNHYYFVSIISFILIFLPAEKSFSFDNLILKKTEVTHISNFYILVIKLQLFCVYFFAGIAKINYDWLVDAQPLKIWLPAFSHLPIIGGFMEQTWLAYIFCWVGCLYDLSIGFFLFNKKTVNAAYLIVIIFHLFTALFFNIGMFPYIMITITIIFLKENYHITIINKIKTIIRYSNTSINNSNTIINKSKAIYYIFMVHFFLQLLIPFRYLFYKGDLFLSEQGYRFSWRVMLMEKAGTSFFFINDKTSGKKIEIENKQYLSYMQEKMMATQPDMMVDYAKFLKKDFEKKGFKNISVTAQSYVTINGNGSRNIINDTVDLSLQSNSFLKNKSFILPQ